MTDERQRNAAKESSKGYIYILTNPSFPDYVKIGYANDVKARLAQLNRSECTPFAFRVYATYEVNARLTDMKIHDVIDKLNPNLRSIDNVDGKKRIREFYAMSREDAYSLLEAIAEINGLERNLKLWKQTDEEKAEEKVAEEIKEASSERAATFAFSLCKIPVGDQIEFCCPGNEHDGISVCVVDNKHVSYNSEVWSLTGLVKALTHTKSALAGPRFFKYKGEWLNDIRSRLGQ